MDYTAPPAGISDLLIRRLVLFFSLSDELSENFPPASNDALSAALIQHFMDHMKLASVGRICMLWLDYAVSESDGAGCKQCLQLANLHSTAVDYPKSGNPAVIPRDLYLPRGTARAHWRESKGVQSFHCTCIVGKLYDVVITSSQTTFRGVAQKALAGRRRYKYGSILCTAEGDHLTAQLQNVYDDRIRASLSITINNELGHVDEAIQLFANQQRMQYENEYFGTMNKYNIRSEGEVATGCIRKFHKLHKKRQHNFADDIRRRTKMIRRKFRTSFFHKVLQLVRSEMVGFDNGALHGDGGEQDEAQDLEDDDDDDVESDSDDDTFVDDDEITDEMKEDILHAEIVATARAAHIFDDPRTACICKWAGHLSAAYYDATYSPQLRWRDRDQKIALFSFPWLVVGDVIACCLVDWKYSEE